MTELKDDRGSQVAQEVTVQNCIADGAKLFSEANLFFGHGTDNASDEAYWLAFFQLGLPWDSPPSTMQQLVSDEQYQQIKQLFLRRINERIPAAYLTGEAWFAGHPFTVNTDVLVPRSPIAELIYAKYLPWLTTDKPRLLDLCTGSGCIGIASALHLQEAQVVLSDISAKALAVAEANIQRYSLSQRVHTVESDGLNAFDPTNHDQQFDLIVSNPPYVDAEDFDSMPAEYHAEPELGLVSGADGLDFTRCLLREAANYLKPEGVLIVEVGNSGEALEHAYPEVPFLWLEFAAGGHGVFVITRDELQQHRTLFE